ncbi:cold shock domain-containing protein [bacterium]|nr:cold shock domain-containing protein [bacterium]
MAVGTVKWFDKKKGYGFIEGDGTEEIFVHYSDIIGSGYRVLEPGMSVRYIPEKGEKGTQAKEVRIIEES